MKKLYILLAISILTSIIFPKILFADGDQPEGAGTSNDPYNIQSLRNLLWVSTTEASWNSYFIQTEDIDAFETRHWNNGKGFIPIGNTSTFQGHYDGNNFVIDGLYINRPNEDYVGFIANANYGSLLNIGLIRATVFGSSRVGILVGNAATDVDIDQCYTKGTIFGNQYCGGLIGALSCAINDCYSWAYVECSGGAGGLIGSTWNATVSNCYSIGSVIEGSYSGGFIGNVFQTSVFSSLWDYETSGLDYSAAGTGKSTQEMQNIITFASEETEGITSAWDFVGNPYDDDNNEDYWNISETENSGYPFLSWQQPEELHATFIANSRKIQTGFPLHFYDYSLGAPTGWSWDFDEDGIIDSYEQNPNWIFQEAGTYTISLTITNESGNDQFTRTDYIVVQDVSMVEPEGSGTESDPFLISNPGNLIWLSETELHLDKHYLQTSDLNMAGTETWNVGFGVNPIGNYDHNFTGYYNGQNYTIDSLKVDHNDLNNVGLFGYTSESTIENLKISNLFVRGHFNVGGLIGHAIGGEINNCILDQITISGFGDVGGLIGESNSIVINLTGVEGYIHGDSNSGGFIGKAIATGISQSYSITEIDGNERTAGFVAYNDNSAVISACYANCDINGINNTAGFISYNNGLVQDCLSFGEVYGVSLTAGFANNNNYQILSSLSANNVTGIDNIAALINDNDGIVSSCFWDSELTETGATDGGFPKTTNDLKRVKTFTDFSGEGLDNFWDFCGTPFDDNFETGVWAIADSLNDGYPSFAWQYSEDSITPNFTSDETIIYGLNPIQFYDVSVGNPTSWEWDFESDGVIDSYEQNPSHLYNETDMYDVTLTVNNDSNTSTITKESYIHVVSTGNIPEGSGSENDPYQISSIINLFWLSTNTLFWDKHFIQTENIDATLSLTWDEGRGFSPIGSDLENSFTGSYDGQNYIIEHLVINRPEQNYIGLFGITSSSAISNISLEDAVISGNYFTAGLVGALNSNSLISNCSVSGQINGTFNVGGLTGFCYPDNIINRSASNCVINGESRVGGITGWCNLLNVNNCFVTGSITANNYTGGLIGGCNYVEITNSYSNASISCTYNQGGLIGFSSDTSVQSSFWDMETSLTDVSAGGEGLTTLEMQTISTYLEAGWDFTGETENGNMDYWDMDPEINFGYPFLLRNDMAGQGNNEIPQITELNLMNYPNPFNPETSISFNTNDFKNIESAKVEIFNIKGQKINSIKVDLAAYKNSDIKTVKWQGNDRNGTPVSSGVYFYKLVINGNNEAVKKCLLLK